MRLPRTITNTHAIHGEIREWYRIGKMVGGYIHGDSLRGRTDGAFIYTALIDSWTDCVTFFLVKTKEHALYVLWKDQCNLTKDNPEI